MKVADVMTRDVLTVEPGVELKEVARILVTRGISGVPVVDDDGTVLGVVSETDILAKERSAAGSGSFIEHVLFAGDRVDAKHFARDASEAMSSPPITIRPQRPVAEAAAMMLDHAVNRLPVVDRDGELVGIVTRTDLVRAFVRPDDEVEREILNDVILRTLWNTPDRFQVDVEDGKVTVGGEVADQQSADLLVKFIERVPGVVSVRSSITWPRH